MYIYIHYSIRSVSKPTIHVSGVAPNVAQLIHPLRNQGSVSSSTSSASYGWDGFGRSSFYGRFFGHPPSHIIYIYIYTYIIHAYKDGISVTLHNLSVAGQKGRSNLATWNPVIWRALVTAHCSQHPSQYLMRKHVTSM